VKINFHGIADASPDIRKENKRLLIATAAFFKQREKLVLSK